MPMTKIVDIQMSAREWMDQVMLDETSPMREWLLSHAEQDQENLKGFAIFCFGEGAQTMMEKFATAMEQVGMEGVLVRLTPEQAREEYDRQEHGYKGES